MPRRARLVTLVVALLAAACGQKPGVSGSAAPLSAAVGTSTSGAPPTWPAAATTLRRPP